MDLSCVIRPMITYLYGDRQQDGCSTDEPYPENGVFVLCSASAERLLIDRRLPCAAVPVHVRP